MEKQWKPMEKSEQKNLEPSGTWLGICSIPIPLKNMMSSSVGMIKFPNRDGENETCAKSATKLGVGRDSDLVKTL